MYVTYFNQLIQAHLNNQGISFHIDKGLPKEIMVCDIVQHPIKFVRQTMDYVSHLLLQLCTIRSCSLWTNYDPQIQSDDICLRDIVYIIVSMQAVYERIRSTSKEKIQTINEMGEVLLSMIQAEWLSEQDTVFNKNFSKSIICMTFAVCLMLDGSPKAEQLVDLVIQSVYQAFKGQVIVANQLRKGLGQKSFADLKAFFDGSQQDALPIDEEIIQSQLQFLRTATACKLIATAVNKSF